MLVLVMLEKLCAAIEPDPTRKKKVFYMMVQELDRVGMLARRVPTSNASYRMIENAFYGQCSRGGTRGRGRRQGEGGCRSRGGTPGQDSEGEEDATIPIVGVRPPVFRTLLRHVYGGVTPVDAWNSDEYGQTNEDAADEEPDILASPSMELLDAANRYGVLPLKILAEIKVSSNISVANASDLILYADSKDAALLKERVVDYFCTHAEEIRRHPSFQKVRER